MTGTPLYGAPMTGALLYGASMTGAFGGGPLEWGPGLILERARMPVAHFIPWGNTKKVCTMLRGAADGGIFPKSKFE
jgi:hypothetical protein